MRFKTWRIWVSSLPWSLKWFVYLILLRPAIDNFYFLKNISPLLSPLYWAGLLTPVFCIPVILNNRYPHNRLHQLFNLWSGLIILNTIFIVFQPVDIISKIQWILKLSIPVYLFFFLRIFIRSKTDFTGLLTTFLYAAAFAGVMLLYELLVKPIRVELSRGLERIQGGYADVMNYAIYLTFGFLVISYFYFSSKYKKSNLKIGLIFLMLISALCFAGLTGISHTASYAVFGALLILFLASSTRRFGYVTFIVVTIIMGISYFYGGQFYDKNIDPLTAKEVEVIEGTRNESQLFHGRMARWQYGWSNFKDSPATAWLFGYPTSLEDPFFNISIGIHNDYLRIFYFTGITGVCSYFLFLYLVWRRKKFLQMPEKYLLYGSLAILLLYSVSTTPTFYANFLYILLTVFAYFSLPPAILVKNE
jgi:hypothetical protein